METIRPNQSTLIGEGLGSGFRLKVNSFYCDVAGIRDNVGIECAAVLSFKNRPSENYLSLFCSWC